MATNSDATTTRRGRARKASPKKERRTATGRRRVEVVSMPIDSLTPDPKNARIHPKRNMEAIVASLREFGQQKPIVVNSKNVVIAGNGTLFAAKELGWTHIDAVRTDLTPAGQRAFAVADNRTAELAEWDLDALEQALDTLQADKCAISTVGFDDADLKSFFGDKDWDKIPEPSHGDEQTPPKTYANKVILEIADPKIIPDVLKSVRGLVSRNKWGENVNIREH